MWERLNHYNTADSGLYDLGSIEWSEAWRRAG